MKASSGSQRIRLTLPFWGAVYAQRVVQLTLPALLAPDNVPALAEEFKVEVSLVTEQSLFDFVSGSKAVQRLKEYADVRLVPLDDLLTGVAGDYGPVLTFALIRGFEDLGERMLDYYLMFLNADFIVANGSYRHLAKLMKEGHRVIHCPSFRGIYEEVVPVMADRLDAANAVLSMRPREMVALALKSKHVTVKARTVNQKLSHQWRMDQFYWYVDEQTLIGYQWPVALVALKPERVVTRPKLMFDYGFIPDICPTAQKYYISDSDDFFMLEPQRRATGADLVRLGWIDSDLIASDLSLWTTKEHRECGQQMHVFHSGNRPSGLEGTIEESKRFMSDLVRRLGPPNPHVDHPLFKSWWDGVVRRMDERRRGMASPSPLESRVGFRPSISAVYRRFVRSVYRGLFGGLPRLYPDHPLWLETHLLYGIFQRERESGARILWVSQGAEMPLNRLSEIAAAWISLPDMLLHSRQEQGPLSDQVYDVCIFELTVMECSVFRRLYEIARARMRDGGRIYLSLASTQWRTVDEADVEFCDVVLPDTDQSDLQFIHSGFVKLLRDSYHRYIRWDLPSLLRPLVVGALLVGLAPVTFLANRRAARKVSPKFQKGWLQMLAQFKVKERGGA